MNAIRFIIPALVLALVLSSFLNDDEIRDLLDDRAKRTMVMTEIVNDHEMMMEMAEHIHGNDSAMKIMRENRIFMRNMIQEINGNNINSMMQNMMNIMSKDSLTCMKFRHKMMEDTHMRSMMREMCTQDGMKMRKGMQNGNGHMHKHRRMNNKE